MPALDYTCPRCGWRDTRSSHQEGFVDALLRAVGLRPVRCNKCGHRFYRFPKLRLPLVLPLFAVLLLTVVGLWVAIHIVAVPKK